LPVKKTGRFSGGAWNTEKPYALGFGLDVRHSVFCAHHNRDLKPKPYGFFFFLASSKHGGEARPSRR